MSHYLKYFATVYLTLVLLVGILIYVFNLGAILLIPVLIASAFLSARYFVKKELRLPTQEEKNKLVWGSTIIAMTFGFIFLVVVIWMNSQTDEIEPSPIQEEEQIHSWWLQALPYMPCCSISPTMLMPAIVWRSVQAWKENRIE